MIKFLKSFFLTLRERFSKVQSPHNTETAIGDDEKLARYIFSARHFSREKLRVKAEAFMPSRGEVSVFRIDGLGENAIWEIGNDVARKRVQTLYARGDTRTNDIRSIRVDDPMKTTLDVVPHEPPPRHANIVGWPENDKPRQKVLALQVAATAKLILKDG